MFRILQMHCAYLKGNDLTWDPKIYIMGFMERFQNIPKAQTQAASNRMGSKNGPGSTTSIAESIKHVRQSPMGLRMVALYTAQLFGDLYRRVKPVSCQLLTDVGPSCDDAEPLIAQLQVFRNAVVLRQAGFDLSRVRAADHVRNNNENVNQPFPGHGLGLMMG